MKHGPASRQGSAPRHVAHGRIATFLPCLLLMLPLAMAQDVPGPSTWPSLVAADSLVAAADSLAAAPVTGTWLDALLALAAAALLFLLFHGRSS